MDSSLAQCAHTPLIVMSFLDPVLEHPHYSPDLASSVFPKMEEALKGTSIDTVETVKVKAAEIINMLSENDLKNLIERCRDRGGEYIEDDKVKVVKEKLKRVTSKISFFSSHTLYRQTFNNNQTV